MRGSRRIPTSGESSNRSRRGQSSSSRAAIGFMPDPRSLSALHTGHVREGASKARRSAHARAPTASSTAHPDAMIHMAFLLEPRLHTPAAPRLISHPSPRCAPQPHLIYTLRYALHLGRCPTGLRCASLPHHRSQSRQKCPVATHEHLYSYRHQDQPHQLLHCQHEPVSKQVLDPVGT